MYSYSPITPSIYNTETESAISQDKVLVQRPAILAEVFLQFPQSLHTNSENLKSGHNCFLPHPFQFTANTIKADSIIKYAINKKYN
jgi:hypothetical protein